MAQRAPLFRTHWPRADDQRCNGDVFSVSLFLDLIERNGFRSIKREAYFASGCRNVKTSMAYSLARRSSSSRRSLKNSNGIGAERQRFRTIRAAGFARPEAPLQGGDASSTTPAWIRADRENPRRPT